MSPPNNYTPLKIERLEEGYHHHETNAVNIAIILIGTLTAGVLAVMLIVSIQHTMKGNAPTTQTDSSQEGLDIKNNTETPLGTIDEVGSPSISGEEPDVQGAMDEALMGDDSANPSDLIFEGGTVTDGADPPVRVTPGVFSDITTPVVTPSLSPRFPKDE